MKLTCCFMLVALAFACASKSMPSDVLQPERMIPIVYDLIKADEWVNGFLLNDSAAKPKDIFIRTYEQVFSIHNVDKATFYKSFKYYQQHPDINKVLFDSIHSLANRQQNLLYQKKAAPVAK